MPRAVLLLFLLLFFINPIQAQENLLDNPGFETEGDWLPIASAGGGVFSAPPGWGGWLDSASVSVPNGYPHRRIVVSEGASQEDAGIANGNNSFIRSGSLSANFGRGGGAFTGAIHQQVAVEEGANVVGSAWVIMNLGEGANLQAKIGIDPNGGTNPNDVDVVWSGIVTNQIGTFQRLVTSTTATGTTVTLFLHFNAVAAVDPNAVYFDDAALTIGGIGNAAPTATPGEPPSIPTLPPSAGIVPTQAPQTDGPAVHIVQSGDTLSAIAVAYGVDPQELIDWNGIADPRLLRVGQEIVVQAPAVSEATEVPPTDETPQQAEAEVTAEVVAATEEPTITPTPQDTNTPQPAPVAMADTNNEVDLVNTTASVCVLMFEDKNSNRILEDGEGGLIGGSIRLTLDGADITTFATDGTLNRHCFAQLAAGEYVAVASAPANYGLTTPEQRRLRLQPGAIINIDFGAAEGVEVIAPPPANIGELSVVDEPEQDDNREQLLQYLGLILFALAAVTLAGGIGVTLALRQR